MSFLHGFCYASIFPAVLNAAAYISSKWMESARVLL